MYLCDMNWAGGGEYLDTIKSLYRFGVWAVEFLCQKKVVREVWLSVPSIIFLKCESKLLRNKYEYLKNE